MKKFLIVVDIQNDFVDGALGSEEAVKIIPNAARKIKDFDGEIFVTYDTHFENYSNTLEGKKLPVAHCIKGTTGWNLNPDIAKSLEGKKYKSIEKHTFGSAELPQILKESIGEETAEITLIGLCTDICVVSNALLIKAALTETEIYVDSACCAGVTPSSHKAALDTMRSCQINIL